jgi:hypothetical protein
MLEARIKVILTLLLAASTVAQGQTARKVDKGVDAKSYNGLPNLPLMRKALAPLGLGQLVGLAPPKT